jgi:predicted dinucleotide-binding enzyme
MRLLACSALAVAIILSASACAPQTDRGKVPASPASPSEPQRLTTVAVIGTGSVGSALGPRLAELGHTVIYGSREPMRESVRTLVARTGPKGSAATPQDAANRAEVVVLAVPADVLEQVTKSLGNLAGKIVVDLTSGAMRRGADGYMELEPGPSNSERVQSWAPQARVVKVAIPGAYVISEPLVLGVAPTVPIASNDRAAKETFARMIAGIGLDPFDAGPLRFARSIDESLLLFMVPLNQGRAEGIEIKFLRSSYFPCFWPVVAEFGPTSDSANLAQFPANGTPRPCQAWGR